LDEWSNSLAEPLANGPAEPAPLQSPPQLDKRLRFAQRTAGDLLEALQALAHRVGVYLEILGGEIDAAIVSQVAPGCVQNGRPGGQVEHRLDVAVSITAPRSASLVIAGWILSPPKLKTPFAPSASAVSSARPACLKGGSIADNPTGPEMIVLATSVAIAALAGDDAHHGAAADALAGASDDELVIAATTRAEILVGPARVDGEEVLAAARDFADGCETVPVSAAIADDAAALKLATVASASLTQSRWSLPR
jgi:predicted nucleic acid-binding protein